MNILHRIIRAVQQTLPSVFVSRSFKQSGGASPRVHSSRSTGDEEKSHVVGNDVQRIKMALVCAKARVRRGDSLGIWIMKASCFNDAYRFFFPLCCQSRIRYVRKGSYFCYEAHLPDGQGNIRLSENVGNRRNTLAVISVDVEALPDVKEIRFLRALAE